MAVWERGLSLLTHGALYTFLLVQPMLGILILWSKGQGIPVRFTDIVRKDNALQRIL